MGEVYRHQGNWKLRALGQGFNGGLEPLAVSYGVDVEPAAEVVPQPARISLEKKLEGKAPALISLRKPVFHWQNTNWIPWKHESLLFSMPQAL